MVYQEMLRFPNLTVAGNIFAGPRNHPAADGSTTPRCASGRRRSSPSCTCRSRPTRRWTRCRRRTPARPGRARARLRLPRPRARRADDVADRRRSRSPLRRPRAAQGRAASRCSSSRTGCPRCSGCAIASRCCATAAYRRDVRPRDVTAEHIVRAMVGREPPPRARGRRARRRPRCQAALARRVDSPAAPCFDRRLAVGRGPAKSSASSASSDRAAPSCSRRSSGSTRRMRARSASTADRFPRARRARRRAAGLALVPEERQRQGLFFNLTMRHNLVAAGARHQGRSARAHGARARARRRTGRTRSGSRPPASTSPPDALSGGNQQKIVAAKWLATEPRVLLLDEPTKGVDVGAKFEIHDIIRREAARGAGCLMVSSDLPEVLALADRILVMREGRLRGELDGAERDRRTRDAPGDAARGTPREEALAASASSAPSRSSCSRSCSSPGISGPRRGRSHPFLNANNGLLILKYSSIYGIAAIGAAIVIISRRHRPGARRGHRARGRRHRLLLRRCATGRSGRAIAPACWSALARRTADVVAGRARRAAAVHRDARRDGHRARRGVHHHRRAVLRRLERAAAATGTSPVSRIDWVAPIIMIALALVFQVLMTRVPVGPIGLRRRRQRDGGAVLRHRGRPRQDVGVRDRRAARGVSGRRRSRSSRARARPISRTATNWISSRRRSSAARAWPAAAARSSAPCSAR